MNEERPPQTPMASPARDIRKLKQNSTAAAGELKEFLGKIRGKSPKEMLGVVASSGLFNGMIQATIAMAILVLALTAGPYAWGQFFGKAKANPALESAETPPQGSGENTADTNPDGNKPPGETDPQTPATPTDPLANPADIADKLGVGETKDAPAGSNPLENSTDDLLKGLD